MPIRAVVAFNIELFNFSLIVIENVSIKFAQRIGNIIDFKLSVLSTISFVANHSYFDLLQLEKPIVGVTDVVVSVEVRELKSDLDSLFRDFLWGSVGVG